MKHPDWKALPEHVVRYNGGVRCDADVGPCACGAHHDGTEFGGSKGIAQPKFSDLDLPDYEFRVWDDGNPHGKIGIVFPNSQLMDVGCHANPAIDAMRAHWVCNALNAARLNDQIKAEPSTE